jgi:hypothetical protein
LFATPAKAAKSEGPRASVGTGSLDKGTIDAESSDGEEGMKLTAICAVPVGMAIALLAIPNVSAQQKCKMSWEEPASDSKYTQQLAIDVFDMPGHQVRVFEIHTVYPNAKPNCEGLKFTEAWGRNFTDYVNRNGRLWGYGVYTLENGDKIYAENSGTTQTVVAPDGSKQTSFEGSIRWTGGTGKYQGVRGIEWDHTKADLDKGIVQSKVEVEYWLEK